MGKGPERNKTTRNFNEEKIKLSMSNNKIRGERKYCVLLKMDGRVLMHSSEQLSQLPISDEEGLVPTPH